MIARTANYPFRIFRKIYSAETSFGTLGRRKLPLTNKIFCNLWHKLALKRKKYINLFRKFFRKIKSRPAFPANRRFFFCNLPSIPPIIIPLQSSLGYFAEWSFILLALTPANFASIHLRTSSQKTPTCHLSSV